jgi:hypothetical protein
MDQEVISSVLPPNPTFFDPSCRSCPHWGGWRCKKIFIIILEQGGPDFIERLVGGQVFVYVEVNPS